MYSKSVYIITLASALSLGACSSTPERIDILEEASIAIKNVDSHPNAGRIAGDELAEAKAAFRNAQNLRNSRGEYDDIYHQAYLALRHAEIAEQRIAEAETRTEIERSEKERTEMRLLAREAETNRALAQAELREREATAANLRADEREREAAAANLLAAERQQEAAAANSLAQEREREAEEARLRAAEQAAEAERRQRAAELAEQRAEAAIAEQKRLEAALAELQAEKTKRGYVLTLGDILFDTDKASLKPGALKNISKIAEFLEEYPEHKLLIEGHADARGDEEYNRRLSENRANSVRLALIDRGIDPGRLDVRGLGESFPVASNDTAAGQQENRRVEIIFSDDEGAFPATAVRSASAN